MVDAYCGKSMQLQTLRQSTTYTTLQTTQTFAALRHPHCHFVCWDRALRRKSFLYIPRDRCEFSWLRPIPGLLQRPQLPFTGFGSSPLRGPTSSSACKCAVLSCTFHPWPCRSSYCIHNRYVHPASWASDPRAPSAS